MTLLVAVSLSSRPWRGALQRHCRDHVADIVVTLLHDGAEAIVGGVDLVLVDDDTSWLSAAFVTQTREAGVAVIGLFDPEEADGFGRQHLAHLGISCAVSATVEVEQLVDLIRQRRPDPQIESAFDAMTAACSGRRPVSKRHIVAVGGPAGAGATEVALGLSQVLASRASRPVLVDVDETHPSLARRLGLAIHPHLLTAVDLVRREQSSFEVEHESRFGVQACLAKPARGSGPRRELPFDVLVGLASRDDWCLARPEDVADIVAELAAQFPTVIARIGPQLEDLSRHVERFETSRLIVGRASRIVGVCDGSATGALRFLDWMVDVVGLAGDTRIDVVINRPPRWAGAKAELVARLRDIVGDRVSSVISAPNDRRVVRAAWDGDVIGNGPFLKAMRGLVIP